MILLHKCFRRKPSRNKRNRYHENIEFAIYLGTRRNSKTIIISTLITISNYLNYGSSKAHSVCGKARG